MLPRAERKGAFYDSFCHFHTILFTASTLLTLSRWNRHIKFLFVPPKLFRASERSARRYGSWQGSIGSMGIWWSALLRPWTKGTRDMSVKCDFDPFATVSNCSQWRFIKVGFYTWSLVSWNVQNGSQHVCIVWRCSALLLPFFTLKLTIFRTILTICCVTVFGEKWMVYLHLWGDRSAARVLESSLNRWNF